MLTRYFFKNYFSIERRYASVMSRVPLAIFEDHKVLNFNPLVYTRPFVMLKVGMKTILERINDIGKVNYIYVRNYMAKLLRGNGIQVNADVVDQDVIFVNARINPLHYVVKLIKDLLSQDEGSLISNGDVIAVKTTRRKALKFIDYILSGNYAQFYSLAAKTKSIYVDPSSLPLIEYPFQLLELNRKILTEDLKILSKISGNKRITKKCVKVIGKKDYLLTEAGVVVKDYVFFNTTTGPIFIDEGAELSPMTYIEGPAYIGKNARILAGSKIRAGTVIGPNSQIEGIVDDSVLLGNVKTGGNVSIRKAYIGENVLIGSNVSIGDSLGLHGLVFERGNLKRILEDISIVGDFAILYSGTAVDGSVKIGVGAQVHGIIQSDIPSFTIFPERVHRGFEEMSVEESIINVKRVAGITGASINQKTLEIIVRHVYWSTSGERNRIGGSRTRIYGRSWV